MLRGDEHQHRNLWCRVKQPLKGVYSTAVGQEEVEQYRRDGVRVMRLPTGQSMQSLGAAFHPFDFEGPIVGMAQRLANRLGVRRIFLDQQDGLDHGSSPRCIEFARLSAKS